MKGFFLILKYNTNNFNEQLYWTFFNLKIYAHLCGYLLTSVCPFIILYALFFIKPKNLWIKNLLAEICHFNTQKYKNLFSQNKQFNKGGNYKL